jgi:lipoprotein-anchoring transpeptidase ErfK/SrfK
MTLTKKTLSLTISAILVALSTTAVHAELDATQLARLGKDLTPNGAEMAGNKEGTIPAWTGGMTEPPAGWKPSMGYVDPFKDEKPVLRIDAKNVDQYKDKITVGMMAMIKKHPNFYLNVYPTHRTFSQSKAVYDATKKQAATAKLDGLSIQGYVGPGTPFPIPKTGTEAMYNHTTRFFGGYKTCRDWLPVRPTGDYYRVGFCEDMIQGQNMEPRTEGGIFSFFGYYDAPETLIGTIYLVHDPVDFTQGARQAWVYNAGQRRVRRAPDLAYDNIEDGTEGMRTTDDYWGFQGSMDRYDFKLVGKKEMYIPYNAYKLQDPTIKYKDMLDKGHVKSELMRYELHRVLVVDATLKAGTSHVIGRRTFYIDEDSNTIVQADGYDGRGNLWRAYSYPLVQAYDAGLMFQAPFINNDLTNGSFMLSALTNERKQPAYTWGAKGKAADFTADAIRRRGTR